AASPPVAFAGAVAVAGIGGGLDAGTRPGDVVVAHEVRGPATATTCASARLLAAALSRRGVPTLLGTVVSRPQLSTGLDRQRGAAAGALVADTESAWLLDSAGDRPTACVRVIADNPPTPLIHPRTLGHVRTALHRLEAVGAALAEWSAALGPRTLLAAGPEPDDADVRALAERCDLTLLAGRVAPTAEDSSVRVIESVTDIDLRWLAGARTIGVAVAPPTPPEFVTELTRNLAGLGPVQTTRETTTNDSLFAQQKEVRAG
ncbi:MAG: hypothetical protein ACRDMV_19305, partial [Streptosporangiales bacterium]